MIDDVELERLLWRWGWCFGGVLPPEDVEREQPLRSVGGVDLPHALRSDSLTVSALEAASVQFIAGAPEPVLAERTVKVWRNGKQIRRTISQRYTAKGKQTRVRHERRWYPDPEAERVEVAALELWGLNRVMGTVLRCEYCTRGSVRGDKVPLAREQLGFRLTLGQYRVERTHAREWMRERLSRRT